MAGDIWVISDTHVNHKNILTFTKPDGSLVRPFGSVEEMNELMIERWNSRVKVGDKVYHLGDVFFGSSREADVLLSRLNGKKRLVVGNHDNIKDPVINRKFEKISMWRKFNDMGLLLTHVPVHGSVLGENRFGNGDMRNVHGHIHHNPSPSERHVCVSVEQTDYYPINIEDLRVR